MSHNTPIRRAGVIGAGVMGSGIAAHFANAGIDVVLLDIVPPNLEGKDRENPKKRNGFADGALKKMTKGRAPALYTKGNAALIRTGNLEDDLDQLASCDLVIEAIIERLDIKRSLFEKLEAVIKSDCIVASNTSGLRIEDMLEGRSEGFQKNFLVMHFFNPVRHMKLLELVTGPATDPAAYDRIARFGRELLGKGIVRGKDTPNFVGNRIGVHSMMTTIHTMVEHGLSIEDVDNITGLPMAHPKSASFRTADLVGLDTFKHVSDNCYDSLPEDEERDVFKVPDFIAKMTEKKLLGNKTKGGFYKKTKAGIGVLDLETLEYRPKGGDQELKALCKKIGKNPDPRERVRAIVAAEGKAGKFAWAVLSKSLAYAARRIGEITDDIDGVDEAMRWGYNWELGPFEVWDALGLKETTERMKADGLALPASIDKMIASGATSFYKDGQVFDLASGQYVERESDPREAGLTILRRGEAAVLKNNSAEAWDIGDGVLALTFKSKSNTLDADNIAMLTEAADVAERDYNAMVIFNEGTHFCLGANLFPVVVAANQKAWDGIEQTVKAYQDATQRLKYAHVPVVAAPYGMTVGGGMELCFACDTVQAAAETYCGLVEVGVGLIPGGAGTLNMLWRALEGFPEGATVNTYDIVTQVFKNIAMADVATSADAAKAKGYFRHTDGVSFDRSRQLVEAKNRALALAGAGYHPPKPRAHKLPGESGVATLAMMVDTLVAGGFATEHDGFIAKKLGHVLCGGAGGNTRPVTEQEILDLEREVFVSLCGEPKSLDRMQHMLTKNKPLRN